MAKLSSFGGASVLKKSSPPRKMRNSKISKPKHDEPVLNSTSGLNLYEQARAQPLDLLEPLSLSTERLRSAGVERFAHSP
jgi:hypothetical protein